MSATYEPGTVAVATVRGVPNVRVFRSGNGWQGPECWLSDMSVTDVRPLVVIDPEDREQVERLGKAIYDNGFAASGRLADALREFANPTPPKPAEPTGLGAVVEDAEGRFWIRCGREGSDRTHDDWQRAGYIDIPENGRRWFYYREIDAVRVLSEGVTA